MRTEHHRSRRPVSRRPRRRPRKRWTEDVEEVLRNMGIRRWRRICSERTEWRKIIEEVKTHTGLYKKKKKFRGGMES